MKLELGLTKNYTQATNKMANFLECVVCGNDNQDREWFVTMVDTEHSLGGPQPVCGFCEESDLHLEPHTGNE